MSSDLKQDILDSIDDIDDLLSQYDVLFLSVSQREPDKVELAALGSILQSFYNGIEGVFLLVSKQIDGDIPIDPAWHQALLNRMTEGTVKRPALLSQETADLLAMYMKFRHFFRYAYSFMLSWQRMEQLVRGLLPAWATIKSEIKAFADAL